jgi:hypothetical protein
MLKFIFCFMETNYETLHLDVDKVSLFIRRMQTLHVINRMIMIYVWLYITEVFCLTGSEQIYYKFDVNVYNRC